MRASSIRHTASKSKHASSLTRLESSVTPPLGISPGVGPELGRSKQGTFMSGRLRVRVADDHRAMLDTLVSLLSP